MFQVLLSDENTPVKYVLSSRSFSSHERVMLGDKLANGVIRTSTKILMPKMKKSINTTIKQSKRNFEDIEQLSPTFLVPGMGSWKNIFLWTVGGRMVSG